MTARVGCDLQAVAPVAQALAHRGRRYLRAVCAPEEVQDLTGGGAGMPAPESVAGRFAAKEAVLKVLRPEPDDAVPWPHILIRSGPGGEPRVQLRGTAQRLARQAGLEGWSVSISHDGPFAMAVAVATESPGDDTDAGASTDTELSCGAGAAGNP
ncbi:holo-ACP synthase [Kocuria tytonicola]|uniref:4'-phosphopantetheinyl transferase superfamily protein n=1 Tax=Kocuria tytonicola TaxID=2055946 RepID=A0A3L9LYX8_9MICC|nr:4'-phosphopantetheinyl transferase superfamily protein [Kocuria tytonicola]RLY91587.1 4'-phosphopantetheinyl transferase superfamily protein [Kocuria tytonicola]RLZ03727.1 holo-ACP synthase [Kocuria tytonicola]